MVVAALNDSIAEPIALEPWLMNVSNVKLMVTPEHFDRLCLDNPDLRLELTKDRELIIMPPTGGESGERNFDLAIDIGIWNRQSNLGRTFDSSTGYDFIAIGGGKMSPDALGRIRWRWNHRVRSIVVM